MDWKSLKCWFSVMQSFPLQNSTTCSTISNLLETETCYKHHPVKLSLKFQLGRIGEENYNPVLNSYVRTSFSRSGSLAVSRSLEDDTQSLQNMLQKVEEKLGLFFSQRKYCRHFTNRRSSSAVYKSDGLYMDFSFLFNWGIFFYNKWFLPFFAFS